MTTRTDSTRATRMDGDATRSLILEAAGECFAAAGYADTAAKTVAGRAGVSLASINYHFGGRQGLYRAVLVEAHRRIVSLADLQVLAGSRLSAAARLGQVIDQLVRHALQRKPGWHVRVLAREGLAPSPHLEVLMRTELPPKFAILRQIVGEIAQIPADDPATVRCTVSVMAPCLLLLIGAQGVPGPLQQVRSMPGDVLAAHLHGFALAGLKAIGRQYRRRSLAPAAGIR